MRALFRPRRPPPPVAAVEPRLEPRDAHDLRGMVLAGLRELEQAAALRLVQIRVALPEEMTAAIGTSVLREPLHAVLEAAIGRAAGGAVLVTGQRNGAVLEVSILGDGPPRPRGALATVLRPVAERLAAHGCALEVPACDEGGSMMVLRVPAGGIPAPPAWQRPRPEALRLPRPIAER